MLKADKIDALLSFPQLSINSLNTATCSYVCKQTWKSKLDGWMGFGVAEGE